MISVVKYQRPSQSDLSFSSIIRIQSGSIVFTQPKLKPSRNKQPLKGEYGGHDVELIWWQKCQRWTAKTFFKIFWFSQVPAAWPVKFYSHFHTPSLRICIQLYCSFIHPCVASSYTRSALTSDPFQHWRHPTPRSQELSPNSPKWRHLEYNFEFAFLFAVTIV